MNKIILLIFLFLTSCTSSTVRNDLNFSDKMSFSEFKIKLKEYSKNNPYPDIDE